MRVSIDADDAGYANFRGFGKHRVFLNNQEVRYVVTADEEQGLVIFLAIGPDGRYIVDHDEVRRGLARGTVRIETMSDG